MVSKSMENIKRGRMTSEEKAEILRLAATMRQPTPGKIAARLNRHPSTVTWFMLKLALITRVPGRAARPYVRNGKTVNPYSEEHDDFITGLRSQTPPITLREIADRLTAKFGIERNYHSVGVRLVQLAAAPDGEVA